MEAMGVKETIMKATGFELDEAIKDVEDLLRLLKDLRPTLEERMLSRNEVFFIAEAASKVVSDISHSTIASWMQDI